jgi:two-component system response regulator RegX3
VPELLLVEDSDELRETLAFLLEREGYQVRTAADGRKALEEFHQREPSLILLDLMIPEVSGSEVCRQIRMSRDVPIIMLTAKKTEGDIVVGLELGADDYITKPFGIPELLARIRSVLRRKSPSASGSDVESRRMKLAVSGITLDLDKHQVFVGDREISLPLREFNLLEFLMRNAGRVLTRSQIIERVWGAEYFGDTKTLDVHVRRLRSKIEDDPTHPKRLLTVRGLGYRFEE